MEKLFSRTEIKMLIYNKVKRGMDYEKAKKEVMDEIKTVEEVKDFEKAKIKQKRRLFKDENK